MNRISILTVCLFIVLFKWTSFAQSEKNLFVSTQGSDKNPGTLEKPFATIERSIDALKKIKEDGSRQPVTVFFREGVYYMVNPLELTEVFNGSKNAPVVFKSYGNENVVFHGGKKIKGTRFKLCRDKKILERLLPEARDKIWVIDLKKEGITDYGTMKQHGFGTIPEPAPLELFIDGEPQILARYPNEGLLKIGRIYDKGSVPSHGDFSNRGAKFGYEYNRPERWAKADEIWLHGKFSYGFNDDNLKVEYIDTIKKIIKLVQPHLYGVSSSIYDDDSMNRLKNPEAVSFRGYYAYNLLEEIDCPGEYYLDRKTGKLYIYPPLPLADADIEVSLSESPFFSLKNVSFIRIEGITFTCARGLGIYLKNSHDITINNCTFSNLGTVAVSMGQSFKSNIKNYSGNGYSREQDMEGNYENNVISNCLIYNTGTGGIVIAGGDRRSLSRGNDLIYNTEFYNTDRINNTYSPAIKLYGVGNIIRNCYFHDMRHMAIGFMGNDHLIEYCRFNHVCNDADDMGAIYTGRDPSSRGTVIQYNYFSNILPKDKETSMCGVYIDDGSGGMTVQNNFFYKVGNPGHFQNFAAIFFHGGFDNKVLNNIFMDCKVAVGHSPWTDQYWKKFLESPLMKKRLCSKVDIMSNVYQNRYPGLKNYFTDIGRRLNLIQNNLLIHSLIALNGDFMLRKNITLNDVGDIPARINYKKVREYFPLIRPFPFEKCGILIPL